MSDWPKYNPERHAYFAPHGSKRVPYCPKTRGGCGQPCSLEHPCRCCETARADAAEAAIQRVRAFCDQRDAEAQAFLGVVALKATARVTTDEIRECLDGGTS